MLPLIIPFNTLDVHELPKIMNNFKGELFKTS